MTNPNSTYPVSGSELDIIESYAKALLVMSEIYPLPESMQALIEDLADEAEVLKTRSLIQSNLSLVNC